jgi:PPOX class probable FMN-dependent enzyme
MSRVADVATLEALYGLDRTGPAEASTLKVAHRLTPLYRRWIEASRFCVLTTVGPGGTDGSPRGDDGPVVTVADEHTLLMPDWRGNRRLDSLRNVVEDGRVSCMFMITGATTVVRVNGTAHLETGALVERFADRGRRPTCVIVIAVAEIYTQCARALIRARLWGDLPAPDGLPSPGDILAERSRGAFDGAGYDAEWPERAARTMW